MFDILVNVFGKILFFINLRVNSYFLSILIFTLLSKIMLFPINIFIQKNSIKMLKIKPELEKLKYYYSDDKEKFMDKQIELFEKEKYKPSIGVIPLVIQIPIIIGLSRVITNPNLYLGNINTFFLGINLSNNPSITDIYIPLIAITTTILLCYVQNVSNILQKAESFKSKIITAIITCIITGYFVMIVPNGVGLYWSLCNIFAIIQMYLLNVIYPPHKYVNYDEIIYWKNKNDDKTKEMKKIKSKEKNDYKKFLNEENKKIVFYSEKNGFYKYFAGIIKYVLKNSNIVIHYITNDYKDEAFNLENDKFKVYYIGKNKCISLFMKMDANTVIMTTPDLQKYYLKKSLVRDDVEYIFLDHGMTSVNLTNRTGALDYFDTVFVNSPEQYEEIRETEELRNTKQKKLIKVGFPLMDDLIEAYENNKHTNTKKTILIAPSYQEDNIFETYLDIILKSLLKLKNNYRIIIRPHPQFIKRKKEKFEDIISQYKDYIDDNFFFESDFSSNETIYQSDLVITDWSGVGFEFALSTLKPALFVNTKMKVMNKDYDKIKLQPLDIKIRNIVGKTIDIDNLGNISDIVLELIANEDKYIQKNMQIREKYLYNVGKSAMIAGKYLIHKNEKTNI